MRSNGWNWISGYIDELYCEPRQKQKDGGKHNWRKQYMSRVWSRRWSKFVLDRLIESNTVVNYVYHRYKYFKKKLQMIAGYKQWIKIGYNDVVKLLKEETIRTIQQLKSIMKKKNSISCTSIYFDLTGNRIWSLSHYMIDSLCNRYLMLEPKCVKQIESRILRLWSKKGSKR